MRVFFLASDNPLPSGGLKFIYRYCELANEIGYNAAVMHGNPRFCVDKFTHKAPVVFNYGWQKLSRKKAVLQKLQKVPKLLFSMSNETNVNSDDIIVIPENRLFRIHEIFPGVPKILLNQNAFLLAKQALPENTEDIIGTINTSKHCLEIARRLLIRSSSYYVPLWLNAQIFKPKKLKKRQIAYMPRRNAQDARMVFNLLSASGAIENFEIIPISNMALDQVAETLRDSLIFLSFSDREGFGLPAAEAIASGCLTIGYTGIGGNEFFSRFGAWPIAQQDILTFADTVRRVLEDFENDPEQLDRLRIENAEALLEAYKRSNSKIALGTALKSMLGEPRINCTKSFPTASSILEDRFRLE